MGGYTDYPAGAGGTHMVAFEGNGYTSAPEVTRLWHRRAAEVRGSRAHTTLHEPSRVSKHRVEGMIRCVDG